MTQPAPLPSAEEARSPSPPRREGGEQKAAFRAEIDRARRRLFSLALLEAMVGAAIGLSVGLGAALLFIGALPFSLGLRAALWALLGLSFVAGAGVVLWRRALPLRRDLSVARALEEAASRRGADLGDAVRGAVELLNVDEDAVLGRSRALCDAHIAQTERRLVESGAHRSLGGVALGRAVPTLSLAAALMLAWGVFGLFSAEGIRARWDKLFDDDAAALALKARAASLVPLVTDLKLTLRFPAYMARQDQVIPGASGDIVAPRGTEILLMGRADRALRAASLLVGDQEVAFEVKDGRTVAGRFVLDRSGSYRFRLTYEDGDTELDPVAHRITLSPDEVPKLELIKPGEDRVVQIDEEIPLRFRGSDDYGVTRVRLVVRRQGSGRPPFEKELLVLEAAPREIRGTGAFTPEETGARPGDRLSVYLEALDNDTVSGPKPGRSETRVLTVFSAAEHHRKLIELEEKLLGRMIHVLGGELEAPISRDMRKADVAEQRRLLARHAEIDASGQEMLAVLDEVLQALADDRLSPEKVRQALANMRVELLSPLRNKRDLVDNARRTLEQGRELLAYVFRHLSSYQAEVIGRLEHHILYLEDLLNTQRIEEARQIVEEMRRTQEQLKELIGAYKKSPDDETRAALLEEIERLREQMRELMARLAALQRDVPDEYLNQEAFESQEMLAEAKDLDELIEEGKLDEAAQRLEEMVKQTEKLLEQLDQSQEEYGGEEYRELREKLERFGQELSALEAKQEELLYRSERLLEAARQKAKKKLAKKLDKLVEELKGKAKEAHEALKGIDPSALLFTLEQEDAAFAEARAADLRKALESGDLEDALESVREAQGAARAAERSIADRTRGRFGTRNEKTLDARDRLQKARPLLEEIEDKLREVLPDPAEMLSEAQRAEMRKDARAQAEMKEQVERLAEKMQEIGKEMPIFGPSHQEELQRAGQSMREAARELGREELRRGRGSQERALESLRGLREALEKMGQGQGGGLPLPLPGGAPMPGGKSDGGRQPSQEKVEIPGADAFRVPDEFRKDILDAMREGAPEKWEGEVKRYYEDLVK